MAFSLKDYTGIQEIGHGGMGKVYLATQISLNRKVIIKEMATGLLTNKTEIKRFENEARAAAALDHDNIIRIYDFGEDRGSFYIAMEYIDGPNLESILKDRTYVPEIGLMIMLFALKGLAHAHSHRIIHRDIKPGNILVSKAGAVKVVDFGLAHASSQQMHLTASDVIVGTPLFMSPEQATGEEKKDLRMDVWSVGVLLYRIITGNYPFNGDNVPSILFHIVQTKESPILEINPALPGDLANHIDKCLIKERGRRLSSLFPLIESLQNYFYDIGIKDPAEEIRRYVGDPSLHAKALVAKVFAYHERKAEEYGAAGDAQRSEAHAQQAKRYDPLYRPIIKAMDAIKKHTSSSILAKQTRFGKESGIDAWKPPSRMRIGRLVFISVLVLAIAVTGAALFYFQRWNNKEPQGMQQPVAVVKQIVSVDTVAGGDSVPLATSGPGEPANDMLDTVTISKKRTKPPRTRKKTGAARIQTDTGAVKKAVAVSGPAMTTKTRKPQRSRTPSPFDSQSGILKVTITPESARVRVDGEHMTKNEMAEGLRLITGLHHLDASAEGYEPFSKSITVEKDAVQIITVDMVPEKPGMSSVHIHSYPWAEIFVDDEFKGNSPTAKPIALTEGTHTIVLKRPGYETYKEKISLKKGELRRIKVQLTREK
ncbi:MAG: serine/threonine protein kinase [Chitinispirillaceae bacterium]|nr:serine/threonine protein kinase [Chitinispirillaceae bacterium]